MTLSCLAFAVLNLSAVQANEASPATNAAAQPASAQTINVEATPAWIRERGIPEPTKARIDQAQSGISYLLVDEQYRTRADGHDLWFRTSTKVTNRSGLEAAGQISLVYDPGFETAAISFVRIIRGGKVIDLTRETSFRIVEREDRLNDGIVTGSLKMIANVKDLRVGDIVDYATIVHTRSTLWPGNAFYHFSQRYSDPVAMRALRLMWPAEMAPRYKAINSDVSFAVRKNADDLEWEWIANDPPAAQGENDVPATAFQWGRIDVSTMKEWADVARWATALYQGDESLPGDFAAQLDGIAKSSPRPDDRLTAATRYIQDNIRYVGEELGEGSYVPRRPKTVLARAFGDCKDKSLLLAVALQRLGIEAAPALVSTTAGERLPDRLPSPLVFDHVIVRAVIDGKVLWLDPTGAHRGGRGTAIAPSNLGYALPIRAGQTALERIDGYGERAGRMVVLEKFSVDEAADIPLTLHVESRFTDARADNMRASLASSSAQKMAEANLKFYRERFPGIVESVPLAFADDRDGNILTMTENYTMSRTAFADAKILAKLITRAYALQNMFPNRQANPRVQPLALSSYLVNEQTIELRVKDRVLDAMDDVVAKGGQASFSRQTTKLPDGLRMTYRLDTGTRNTAAAADAEEIYALSDKIKDEVGIEFYLEKSARTVQTPKGIDASTWTTIKSDVENAVALMQKNNESARLEALALLSGVSEKVKHPSPAAGMVEGLRGALLNELRRHQAALAALRSATAQYEGNPEVFRLWLAYELDLGTAETFAKALQQTRKSNSNVVATLDKQWVQTATQKVRALPQEKRETVRGDICIELAKAEWQQNPRSAFGNGMLGCAVAAYSRRGDLAEARLAIAKGIPTDSVVAMAMDRRHQQLWPEIDKLGSDGFRKSLEQEAARAAVAAKASPKDYSTVSYQMQTLRALGRFQEALTTGKALAGDKAQIEVVGSDAFWLVNEYASNLRALGRLDEAIAAMDGVLALGEDRYPELTSLAINRTEMVTASGRYQAALDSLNGIETDRFDNLSAYGKMWVWANKACALQALGRSEEAGAIAAKVMAKPEDNWNAATAQAACRNDPKAISDMLITRLRNEDTRTSALALFLAFGTPEAYTPSEKAMRQVVAQARARPDVQAELAKYGRSVRYAGTSQGWSEF